MLSQIIMLITVLFAFCGNAKAIERVVIEDDFEEAQLTPFAFLADPVGDLNFETLPRDGEAWQLAPQPSMNLGYTATSYWLRFQLAKKTSVHERIFLEISYPLHDRLEIHIPDKAGHYTTSLVGDSFPFSHRSVHITRFVFELNLNEVQDRDIYINIRSSSSMRIGMRLYTTARLLEKNQLETGAFFLFYGTMGAMILYNILLYVSIREPAYLYYVLYILSYTLFQMSLNGHLLQFLLPTWPKAASSIIPTLVGTSSIGISLFTQSFLETKIYTPRYHKALHFVTLSGFLIILFNIILPYSKSIVLANALPFAFSTFCFASGVVRWRQGYKPAGIYVLAFAAFFLGVLLGSAMMFGFLSSSALTEYGAQSGAMIEVIMLSIALASKINGERKSRYEAQKEALELALEKQHSYQQMEKLLYPHQLIMVQKGQSIETTMPTGTDIACVLSFDVINSSKVKSEGFNELMEDFLSDCRNLMMRGYDGQSLTSAGYMIKEMGDGFLCSVGFPLKQLGQSKAECAVDLALQIISRFALVNEHLDAPTPLHCCIGVATGQVRSYFSQSGSVKYDMWGRGIILATRYESLRKEIMLKLELESANMLILQEEVYYSLPSDLRKRFQVHNLADLGLQVRDHPEAKTLVFMQIPASLQVHPKAS
jgi:class 3 adenylate cyclase